MARPLQVGRCAAQVLGRLGELPLGLGPAPLPGQHRAVVRPAGAGDEVDPHPAAELLDLAAPLPGALVVAHPLARVEQQATGPPRGHDLLVLARQRRGGGLVEAAHAVRGLTFVHQRHALDGEREHLQRDHAEPAAQLARPDGELPCPRLIALRHRHVAQQRIEPAVLGTGLEPLEDAGRALEPAVGDRALAAKDQVIVGEPDRQHRRPPHVSLLAAEPVGALARLEAGGHVLDPPRGPAQALQRLDRLASLELSLEDRPRLIPRPAGERGFALSDPLVLGRVSAMSEH